MRLRTRVAALLGVLVACGCDAGVRVDPSGPVETDGNGADHDERGVDPGLVPELADGSGEGRTAADAGRVVARAPEILPVVLLTVDDATPGTIGDDKVSGLFRLVVDHDGSLRELPNQPVAFESWAGISRHGSSSRWFAQKSFGIELRDAEGLERKIPVLGMPADSDWVLLACWVDKPCMRNALMYTIGQQFGRWTPRFRFVELLFNGVYQGLYQLVELPRFGKNRIPAQKAAADPGAGDTTGSYLFSREGRGRGLPTTVPPLDWKSPVKSPDHWVNQIIYTYRIPKGTDVSDVQRTYIQRHMTAFEEMMKTATWADPGKGYRAWIEMSSWIDHAITSELTNNIDAYFKSNWLLKEPDPPGGRGKLHLFPIWDFNLAFGNADLADGQRADKLNLAAGEDFGGVCTVVDWLPQGPPLCDADCCQSTCMPPSRCWNMPMVPFYWSRLWRDPAFVNDVRCRWEALRKPGQALSLPFIDSAIDGWKAQLGPLAIPRHLRQWPQLLGYVWPSPYFVDPTTAPRPGATIQEFFEGEVAWLRRWIGRRLAYLDTSLPGVCSR